VATRAVAVGASAGGVDALSRLVEALPADFPGALLVVLHISPASASVLPQILVRAGSLPAAHAHDGEPIEPGRIYVAPPDFHLLVLDHTIRVVRGPTENNHRPAIDPLFRSLALSAGPDAIAVVLTGALDDGSAGAVAVSARGGTVLVQDPEEAAYPAMPLNAIAADPPCRVATVGEIARIIDELVRETSHDEPVDAGELELQRSFAGFELGAPARTGLTART